MLRTLGTFILWNLAASLALIVFHDNGLLGLAVVLLLTGAFLRGHLLRPGLPRRHWLALRMRPIPRRALPWLIAGVPLFLAFNWALGELYVRLVPVPTENFDPFSELMQNRDGRLAITLLAVAIAPLLEELVFRGLLQSTLERKHGPLAGMVATSFLFALIHFLPWILPLHFFLGLSFGYVVYVTRSVWAGVILHAANNAAAMLGVGLQPESPAQAPTVWETGPTREWWVAVLVVVVLGSLLAKFAVELWSTRPGGGLRRNGNYEL